MGTGQRWDLGFRYLRREWAALLRGGPDLRADVTAAVSVALLAIPLSLAIALASGVAPAAGLASAIVAGMVASMFGGTPLSVSGPAAAMAVLIMNVVEHHGMGGLLLVGLAVGALQVITGVLGFGRVARLVPLPVIEGFTAGIGAIILVGQLPRALGLKPPEESHFLDVITHISELIHETRAAALVVALSSLAICMFAPRVSKRIPGPLLAVTLPSIATYFFAVPLETVASVPRTLHFSWPSFDVDPARLVSPVLMVFALASLESLLSAAAVDKLARGVRHDPDQEFIGQGLANMGSALFGGIPVTGVIARSALNVQAGGRTRRAAFLHALFVLLLVLGAAPLLQAIPVAALAGVLMSVALRMLNPGALITLYKSSRADAAVFVVTFVLMVALDLIQGVQWGLGAALIVAAIMTTRNRVKLHRFEAASVHRLVLEGSITFLSAIRFDALRAETAQLPRGTTVILDLSEVTNVDASGGEYIADFANFLLDAGLGVVLLGMAPEVQHRVLAYDHQHRLAERTASSEAEVPRRLPRDQGLGSRLTLGVAAYRRKQLPRYQALFESLANGQHPHTLFVTCADSRIVPNLITDSAPGELFIMRNVGNMVPPFNQQREMPASGAGVDYAVGVLNVSDIVVCAHARCGAIGALRHPENVPANLTSLHNWLSEATSRKLCQSMPDHVHDDDVARANAVLQIENLRTYAIVREREAKGTLRLWAWFFDIGTGDLESYDFEERRWERVGEEPRRTAAANDAAANPSPAPSAA